MGHAVAVAVEEEEVEVVILLVAVGPGVVVGVGAVVIVGAAAVDVLVVRVAVVVRGAVVVVAARVADLTSFDSAVGAVAVVVAVAVAIAVVITIRSSRFNSFLYKKTSVRKKNTTRPDLTNGNANGPTQPNPSLLATYKNKTARNAHGTSGLEIPDDGVIYHYHV